ncbi:MAG: hypothetical protein ACUVSY_02510 [Roseiflexus sp.]
MRLPVHEGHTLTILSGPENVRHAHRSDKRVALADLEIATHTPAPTALRFCGIG